MFLKQAFIYKTQTFINNLFEKDVLVADSITLTKNSNSNGEIAVNASKVSDWTNYHLIVTESDKTIEVSQQSYKFNVQPIYRDIDITADNINSQY